MTKRLELFGTYQAATKAKMHERTFRKTAATLNLHPIVVNGRFKWTMDQITKVRDKKSSRPRIYSGPTRQSSDGKIKKPSTRHSWRSSFTTKK